MSKPLRGCCKNAICKMITEAKMGASLQIFLAASPFILIIPDIVSPPGSAQEAAETIAEKLTEESGTWVVEKVTKSASLPDFADSVRAVNEITLNMLHTMAFAHSGGHARGITEGQLWNEFVKIYSPEGEIRKGGSGWDLNPFW